MTSAFRTTALVAALAAFSHGAFAAPVVLDFNDLGEQAFNDKAPINLAENGPVDGFFFQGAWAYRYDMMTVANDPKPGDAGDGGFLVNRDRGGFDTKDIVVSLDELVINAARLAGTTSAYAGRYFDDISFSLFTSGDSVTVNRLNAKGELVFVRSVTPTNGLQLWSVDNNKVDLDATDEVRTLVFSTQGALLGLDSLQINLTEAIPGGGDVPEPASYALVGLALLAAGTASRRRR